MDIITTGRTAATKMRIGKIAEQARDLLRANFSKYLKSHTVENFLAEFTRHYSDADKVSLPEMHEAFRMLQSEDLLALYGGNRNNQQFKVQKEMN